jgi:ubiquinone/menaquinone biosynthesis C-methylase UbiE
MDRLLELTALAERSHFWFRGFRWFIRPVLARAAAGPRRARILDCGCGTGSNLELLDSFGEVYGFDLTWRGLRFAHEHGRRRIAHASIDAIPFHSETFDLVTSFDVFQGLPAPIEEQAAREMARVLKPGGAAVFNFAALEILRGGHSVLAEEVRRYTPATVRRLVGGAGLVVEQLTFLFASVFPLLLAARLVHRLRRRGDAESAEWEIEVPAVPVNALLTAAVWAEAQALRVIPMPIGSSIVCLARKPQ